MLAVLLNFFADADRAVTLAVNGGHSPWLDWLMALLTEKRTWVPFYIALAGWLFYKFRLRAVLFLAAVGLAIALADQFSSALLKPWVARLRPCHEPSLAPLLHLPVGCGGQFGFVSSHAANTLGLVFLFWLQFGRAHTVARWVWPLAFAWAVAVSYSRIYLGAHYLTDVICGGAVGVAASWLVYRLYALLASRTPLQPYFIPPGQTRY